jgi:DNA-binding transcriptional MocR family regulator
MDIPSEVINAVKETKQDLATPKARKPYVKKLTKRILHAIGNGLRTSTSIANALGVDKSKIHSNLSHIKAKGLVISKKQDGKAEHKYYLNTEQPKLDGVNIDMVHKKSGKVRTVRRVTKPAESKPKESQAMITRYVNELEMKLRSITDKLVTLEVALSEKDKEVWTLECEIFDKKAVIKYLEEKLFGKGSV